MTFFDTKVIINRDASSGRMEGKEETEAQKMKLLIEQKGITYTFISEKTGIPVDALSKSFLGKRRLPADEMISICREVGIDLSDLAADRVGTAPPP